MSELKVSILMSVYNGDKFIKEQIESILEQTYPDFTLYIRDDGSTDNTKKIINEFSEKDSRVVIYSDSKGNLKPAKSFIEMLLNIDSEIYMFSDQDDVWKSDKVSNAVGFLRQKLDDVVLYCTDLEVVDQNLNTIHSSFMTREKYNPLKQKKLANLFFQNFVVGCTAAFTNKTNVILRKFYRPESNFIMHDWLLALIASSYGYIHFDPIASIMYRQHQNNSIGSPGTGLKKYMRVFLNEGLITKTHRYLKLIVNQFALFDECFLKNKKVNNFHEYFVVSKFMHEVTAISFLKVLWLGVGMNGFIRNFALLLVCFLGGL